MSVDAATPGTLAAASAASAASGVTAATAATAAASAVAPKGTASVLDTGLAGLKSSVAKVQFDKQQIGSTSAVKSITLTADPAAAATTVFELHAHGDFTVVPTKCELAAKSSCALSVSFAPGKAGETSSAIVASTAQGGPTRVVAELAGEGIGACQARGLFPCTGWGALAPVVFLALIYWVAVIMARWNMVALPTRALLQAEIDAVEARLASLACVDSATQACHEQVALLLGRARKCLKDGQGLDWLLEVAFWSRGREQAGWQLVHEAKEQMAALLPPEDLRVALEDAEVLLRQNAGAEAVALADQIHAELALTQMDVTGCPAALLRDVKAFLTAATSGVAADVAAMLDTQSPATSDDLAALSARLVVVLAPLAVLSAPIKRALTETMPCECQFLLKHTLTVLLPQTAHLRESLGAPPGETDDARLKEVWRHRLAAFQQEFLAPAEAFRLCLERAMAAAPWPQSQRRASLLCEARNQLYDSSDVEFASIASWHKKTAWLVGCALLLIVVLSATFGHATLFLLGALGGLLSRFSRVLVRQQLPTDYGFSWTTLFLSPMVGALAGWAGVLLLALAVKFKVLGDLFASVSWADPHSELVMGLALVLGISERLFVKIVEGVESKVGTGAAADATAAGTAAGTDPVSAAAPGATPPAATPKAAKPATPIDRTISRVLIKR